MKTRLTNLKRISNRQHPSAALAAGDVAFFALGQILHDRAFSAAAFLFEPVLVDDLVKTVGELVVEVELAVICFVFLQPQLGTGAFVRVFQAFVRRSGSGTVHAAAVSEIPYDLAFSGRWMDAQHQNVCLTFFLALVAMELLERYGNGIWEKLVLTAVFCTLTEAAGADGGAWGMGLVLAFYFCVIGNSGTNVPRHILFHEKTAGVFMKMIAAVLIGAFAWQEPLWVLALTAA